MKKFVVILLLLSIPAAAATDRDPRRAQTPQSERLIEHNRSASVSNDSPVLLRIFKEERVLELWRQHKDGRFVRVSTIEICKVSGGLGPKRRYGDLQGPEGFYEITASSLNPLSREWLSINTGYPNQFDRANRATGDSVMIHGGCRSVGCYAIEDGPIQELYAAVRDALSAGQRTIQLQIYPFRMGYWNWKLHEQDQHAEFWQQLKAGYDRFEQTNQPLDIRIERNRYIVNNR